MQLLCHRAFQDSCPRGRSWTLIPERDAAKLSEVGAFIAPVAALAEILRRAMW